jgi:XTP/dITP diphosphohydrolase
MQKLLIATTNKGKIAEIGNFLSDIPVQLVSLRDVGITEEVIETGKTYEENSKLKALTYAKLSGLPAVSDDGGIEIDALGGEPGVHSKYWAGPEGKDEAIIEKMKKVAQELPDNNREAVFRTIITLALPDGTFWQVEGHVDGIIAKEPLLNLLHGYPYRSFFYLPKIKKYYHESELTGDEEKEYNHRWKAVNKLKPIIKKVLSI